MKHRSLVAILLVSGTIVLGIAVILISLFANRQRWDRETALAAAKHDGATILALFDGEPSPSLGFPEMESGPLAPDLSQAEEAWISWRQNFSGESGLPAAIRWHRTRLPAAEWELTEESPDKATFRKGEWTVTLQLLSTPPPVRLHRELRWTRDPDIL